MMDLSAEFMKVLKERDLQKSRGKKVVSLEDLFDREGDYLMKNFSDVKRQLIFCDNNVERQSIY